MIESSNNVHKLPGWSVRQKVKNLTKVTKMCKLKICKGVMKNKKPAKGAENNTTNNR